MSGNSTYNNIVASLSDELLRHLPLFHDTSPGGFAMIHAKWPAYPTGDGLICAVSMLAEFPDGTKFIPIDWIDRYTLFVADESPKKACSASAYHICLADDDIKAMIRLAYVDGPTLISNEAAHVGVGDHVIDYFLKRYLLLSEKGRHVAAVFELAHDIYDEMSSAVRLALIEERYVDAVRDSSIELELKLKSASGTKKFGQQLIDECFGENGRLLPQSECTLTVGLEIRAMFRRFFKYVRNEVAHGKPSFSLLETCSLLRRCSILNEITNRLVAARTIA